MVLSLAPPAAVTPLRRSILATVGSVALHAATVVRASCGFNVDTVALPDIIQRTGRHIVKMELELLDRQEYFATIVEGFK